MLNLIPSLLGTLVYGLTSVSVDGAVKLLTPGVHTAMKSVAIKAASVVGGAIVADMASRFASSKAELVVEIVTSEPGESDEKGSPELDSE